MSDAGLAVSILVISYNTRELTIACLRSVFEETKGIAFEVIAVDNASADGSADAIAARCPEVQLIASPTNTGFAGGCNLAAARARGDYLLLLNPDTLVLDRAVEKLYAFARRNPACGIYGGRTLYADRSLNPTCCWAKPTLWGMVCRTLGLSAALPGSRLFNPEGYGGWLRDDVRAVDIVQGSFFLIERALWERLGGFDPAFFMYSEEADLCLRAAAGGARPTFTPEAEIVHYGGASEPIRGDKLVRLFTSKGLLIDRHWHGVTRVLGRALLRFWALSRLAAFAVASRVRSDRAHPEEAAWRTLWERRADWD